MLAYVAFALPTLTRQQRGDERRPEILTHYDAKLQAFLDFVLGEYVKQGISERDQDKLGNLITLKYHTVNEAAVQLGGVPAIKETLVGFQQFLYSTLQA